MTDNKYLEFKENFKNMGDKELISVLDNEIGNPGWVSTRAIYLTALREEFENRKLDYSVIRNKLALSKNNK